VGAAQCSCQYYYSWLLSRRSKSPPALQRGRHAESPGQKHFGPLAHGRFGQAEELMGAVIFLASSRASSFVTGADFRVDGGYMAQTV